MVMRGNRGGIYSRLAAATGRQAGGELEDGEACMCLTSQSQLRLEEEEKRGKGEGTDSHGRAAVAQDIFIFFFKRRLVTFSERRRGK